MAHIMDLNIENLAKEQYNYLKDHTIKTLLNVIEDLENDNFKSLEKRLVWSPAGDGMGEDNYYINFGYKEGMETDLHEIIDEMASLKRSFTKCEVDGEEDYND